jgi:P27 family predicted phage terminase small subunit
LIARLIDANQRVMTKKKIIERLKALGVYDDAYKYLVDELHFNLILLRDAKKELKDKGLLVKGSADPDSDYVVKNPAVNIYNDALKNILNISRKMGLSPRDQKDIINNASNLDDGFFDDDE